MNHPSPRVLIFEEEGPFRTLLSESISSFKHCIVDVVSTPFEAYQKALSTPHRLIILNLEHPAIKGILLQEMIQHAFRIIFPSEPKPRIIYLKNQDESSVKKPHADDENMDILTKPFKLQQIFSLIDDILPDGFLSANTPEGEPLEDSSSARLNAALPTNPRVESLEQLSPLSKIATLLSPDPDTILLSQLPPFSQTAHSTPQILPHSFMDRSPFLNFPYIKICGIKDLATAEQAIEAGANMLGFNFYPKSKRYLDPEDATWLKNLAGKVIRVGVFVNADANLIQKLLDQNYIDLPQFHGTELPDNTRPFSSRNSGRPIGFIKAIPAVSEAFVSEQMDLFDTDMFLLDTPSAQFGGVGETFSWDIATQVKQRSPHKQLLIAGGLKPDNVVEAIQSVHPEGVDTASGVESAPGKKCPELMRQFIQHSQQAFQGILDEEKHEEVSQPSHTSFLQAIVEGAPPATNES